MKIAVFSVRKDEPIYLKKFGEKLGVAFALTNQPPTLENAELVRGCECMSIITTAITKEMLAAYRDLGLRFISTRTIGYEHIDMKAAEKLGIHVGNVSYSPDSVADYAVMLILAAMRNLKLILDRYDGQDYSLAMVRGLELHNLTVGVLGTGRIGRAVLKRLSGFGCRLLAYDIRQNEEAARLAEYVPLDTLLAESDILDLHVPAAKENVHMFGRGAFQKMKSGVYLVNTARGSLIDSGALIENLESGKVAGAALDVVEDESALYYRDYKGKTIKNRELAVLRSFPNVLLTPHTAFYTDQAVSDMVEHSLESCVHFVKGEKNPWQIA